MRGACLIGLLVAAGMQLGCTDPNPRYRVGLLVDGGADGPGSGDAQAVDQAPAPDTEPALDAAPEPDAPSNLDGLVTPDLTLDVMAMPDLPPDAFEPPAGCGTMTTNVSAISSADGVVVDTDGFIYTLTDDATHSYVGKIPPGGAADDDWLTVTWSPTTFGLALDSAAHILYVLVVDGPGAIVRFQNIKAAAVGDQLHSSIPSGDDVVVGRDGHVYYTQQDDGHVYAVTPAKTRRRVTSSRIGTTAQLPAALTFEPGGSLLVGTEEGPIYRITLANGMESGRVALTGWSGWANGMTHDRRGRLYVAQYHDTQARAVIRLDLSGNAVTGVTTIASGGRFSSIAFGRGALDCRDLYITDPWSFMRRVRVMDAVE